MHFYYSVILNSKFFFVPLQPKSENILNCNYNN